jgi:Ca-activated chloride channel family protein
MLRNPSYLLWMVLAVGAAAALHYWAAARRREIAKSLGEPGMISRLTPLETAARRRLKAALLLSGLAFVFAALAGPQWGVELVTTSSDARQVFIAVDTSLSMTAEDVSPNRLEKAKRELAQLLAALKGDRVGVIAFAGDAGILCPLTTDVEAAKQILSGVTIGSIPVPGTAIGTAVRLATSALQRYPGGKALVLLTDGEDHHTDPLGAAAEAAASGVKIYAVGIGTVEGNPLPIKEEGSGALTGYKKDRKGSTVISRLGEKTLTDMAASTGGAYYRASPAEDEVIDIARRIEDLEKSQGVSGASQQYRNRFLFPLAAAFLVLLAEMLVPLRRSHVTGAATALLLLCLPAASARAGDESDLRAGNSLYHKRKFEDALGRYRAAQRPGDPRPDFNSGDALYRLDNLDEAAQKFQRLAEDPKMPPQARSAAYYNLGDALVRKQDYAGAVAAYRRAVLLAPKDRDSRENLAVALRMLKHPPPPKKKDNKPNQDKKKDEKKDQKDKSGGNNNESKPPPPAPRPQDQMSKDDAQRIMRSVAEKEKSTKNQLQQASRQKRPPPEEDW